MEIELIKQKKAQIAERYGRWTMHPICLGSEVYTTDSPWADARLRSVVQLVSDITDKPLHSLRVLDLAACEGLYGVEFALHGAQVVVTEGREANCEKIRFAKEALALDNLECVQDDVRHLDAARLRAFRRSARHGNLVSPGRPRRF